MPASAPAPAAAAGADSVEEIHSLIRRLAQDLNSASPNDTIARDRPADPTDAIDASVDALRSAADHMHGPDRLAEIAEALAQQSVDVLLDPIMGLEDKKTRHFEIALRVKLGPDDSIAAKDLGTMVPGSGLLPVLDHLRVDRTVRVARHLESKGRGGSLFSGLNAESLGDDRFLNQFADTYRDSESVASRLVFSLRQQDARTLSNTQCATLKDMSELGFRFALEDVTDLDMDFEAMKSAGFSFVKLDAAVFLDGLSTGGSVVPPADLCRHLSGLGFGLIVGRIDDERQLAKVIGFGAVLGQGALFGAPRPIKGGVLKTQNFAAA